MLVRPDVTYIDHATKGAARVFPIGTKWLEFESRLPKTEVFRDAVMDPAIGIDPARAPDLRHVRVAELDVVDPDRDL